MVKGVKKQLTGITRELTFNVSKYTHKVQFKKRAPRCIREIKGLVAKMFRTEDVRIDTKLNKLVWSRGIHALPKRIRMRVTRKENESLDKGVKYYCLVEGLYALTRANKADKFAGKLTEKVALQ